MWLSIDPLAEEFPEWSPYSFCFNNPLSFVDPDGMAPEDIILRGKNNSSLTIKTDIVNISLNVSSLGIDFKGNHTLTGDNIIEAALDIGGAIDQTGIVDGAAALYYGKKGDWGDALISGISIAPGGDVLKLGKVPKHMKTIENAIDAVNSADNAKALLKQGRSGKQERLVELATDPKLGKSDKGWIKQEMNQIDRGKRTSVRNPPGKDLAHERGREAAKGYSYKHSNLQNRADHRTQHRYDNNGKKNKERKVN